MTIHAPRPGEFDPAAFMVFASGEPVLGLDVETSAIPDGGPRFFAPGFTLRLVQFGSEREAWVLDMADPTQRAAAASVLADPARRFVTHTSFDVLAVWAALGVPLGQRVADTHLLSKLLDPDERVGHGLKELSARHLDGGLSDAEAALQTRMRELAPVGHRAGNAWLRWGWDHMPPADEAYAVYAGLDAIYARRLLPVLLAACARFAHLAVMDTWLAAQSVGITIRGLRLDGDYTRRLLGALEAEQAAAERVITAALGCPGGSPKVADWLASQCATAGITDLPATPGGRMQVTADALTTLLDQHAAALSDAAREVAAARLAMSRASNLIANLRGFLAAAGADGRVHPQVNTLRAKTARMSITGPALQTLKKHDGRLRRCFTADPGHVLISCDFSQVEVRVAAALADDPTLRDVILSGADIHDATARLMYGPGFTDEQRTIGKRATFGTIYGGGARALAGQTGVSEETARQVIDRWRSTYPRVIAYGRKLAELAEVVTASGRRIPADLHRPYANGNYAVQSTARDLLLAAAYILVTRHGVGGLWLFVHDEIIVQAPEADAERVRAMVEQAMTSTFRGLPIVAEAKILGSTWGRADTAPAKPAGDTRVDNSTTADNIARVSRPGPAEGVAMTATPSPARRVRTLDIALWCAARGWHVVPLRSGGKQPAWHRADRCPGTGDCAGGHVTWEARATADPARVPWVFGHSTRDAPLNVGIAAGPSGLIVLDLDVPKPGQGPPPRWARAGITDGADVLADLCDQHGEPLPFETFMTRTRRGGMHLYFTPPPGMRPGCTSGDNGGLGWLIDTRGHGGYVVAPGCYVADDDGAGWYEAIYQRPPAKLPGWLASLLTAPAPASPLGCPPAAPAAVRDLDGYAARALKGELHRVTAAAEGGRNAALNKAAYYLGQLVGAGILPEDVAVTELTAAANIHYGPSFTADAAAATISSALAAGKRAPRRIAA
jgi:DNA polymerase-1